MNIDIKKITEGQEYVTIRYKDLTPSMKKIIGILEGTDDKLWGKTDTGTASISIGDLLYLESVDDKLFAYTKSIVLKIDGSLNSFMTDYDDGSFFRCSKSMVINVSMVKSLKSLSSNRIDATMEGGEHIIISRRYASEFRRLLKGGR
ncbi:MAG: LytTR family transcriptional regulator DNA-binding domain-containing protein, partial [Butyrivibrio sp.]|uniref:LytTR family DNA-binding domain-containing protein n=1 Tax=Butyrivibrio sp. TaxID=28121 RepID=UPI0025FD2E40|nr:LytTR family DNA-binding domain-containing protein [Butyrivibrio sp.]MCR5772443.1 LytTR family transcriptional regulator DNA-binding domain-containing protein [Butyrivibrio sp.]